MKMRKALITGLLSLGFLLTSCGSTPVSTEPTWEEISYDDFKAAYAAREAAPWNHFEGTIAIDNYGYLDDHTYAVAEDYIDGQWVLDTEKSDASAYECSGHFILRQADIDRFEDYDTTIEKKGDEYRFSATIDFGGIVSENEMLLDRYFYGYTWVCFTDGVKVVDMSIAWSVK